MPDSSVARKARREKRIAKNLVNCKITNAVLLLCVKQNTGSPEEKILEQINGLVETVKLRDKTFKPLLRDPRYPPRTRFNDKGIRFQLNSLAKFPWILNPSWEADSPIYWLTDEGDEKLIEWAQELPVISKMINPEF